MRTAENGGVLRLAETTDANFTWTKKIIQRITTNAKYIARSTIRLAALVTD